MAIAAIACAALAFAEPVEASDTTTVVRLEYQAAEGCPTQAELEHAIRSRAPQVRISDDDDRSSVLHVEIDRANGQGKPSYRGSVRLRGADGHELERRIEGATCADVVAALALVAALDLKADAEAPAPPPEPLPIAPEAPSSATADAGPPASSAPAPSPAPAPPAPAAPSSSGQRFVPAVLAELGAHGGVSPDVTPAFGVALELRQHTATLIDLLFRANVSYGVGTATQGDRRMVLRLFMASIEACPLRAGIERVNVAPCLRFEAGRQSGEISPGGAGVVAGAWLAPGALLRVTAVFAGNVFLEAAGGVVAPLTRNRFFVGNSNDPTHATPVFAGRGDFSMGISFP